MHQWSFEIWSTFISKMKILIYLESVTAVEWITVKRVTENQRNCKKRNNVESHFFAQKLIFYPHKRKKEKTLTLCGKSGRRNWKCLISHFPCCSLPKCICLIFRFQLILITVLSRKMYYLLIFFTHDTSTTNHPHKFGLTSIFYVCLV